MVRRKFSSQFKQQVVKECLETGVIAVVARKHDLGANVVNRWTWVVEQHSFPHRVKLLLTVEFQPLRAAQP